MVKKKTKKIFLDIRKPRLITEPAPNLTVEQEAMSSMFGGGERSWGTGESLPRFDGAIISGGGLIKSGDDGETASLFGARRRYIEEGGY